MNFKKIIKSNTGFIIAMIVAALVAFNPKVKGLLMRGLIKTGLFAPDVSHLKPKPQDMKAETASASAEEPQLISAPSADFVDTDGKTVNLQNLKGKVVFLNFWATWCPPCIAEMPSVNALYNKFKGNKNAIFLLVDADGKMKQSSAFMKKHKYDLPVYIPAGPIPGEIFRGSLPTTIIINKKGKIVFGHEGMADYDSPQVNKFINDLINE